LDNFLLEWHPESLRVTGVRGIDRPRVYMIDFETAIDFGANADPRVCLSRSWPFPKDTYDRPLAPELENGDDYCPFDLDIWQFANGFRNIRVSLFLSCRSAQLMSCLCTDNHRRNRCCSGIDGR
jgi:hypothetical protein